MCMPKPPKPPAPPPPPPLPPPPPPAPEPTAEAPKVGEDRGRTAEREVAARKRGTNSLRIDVNLAQPGGQGLNIPRG